MEYAVVDIETTGGYALRSGITEIAIFIHNGTEVIDHYETLINPFVPIPLYIQALTGISDEMVCHSPSFNEIASRVYKMLVGRVFVAHNVNFDVSFVKHHLEIAGFSFRAQKLCTVRLSRKLKPGLKSYSLGRLCDTLGIPMSNRHRAGGDAAATSILFTNLLKWDTEGHIKMMLKNKSKEQQLPPNLPREEFEKLPSCPGVYYFNDQKGNVVYVGKAKDIRNRVSSHFTGHSAKPQRQYFLRSIYSIHFERCGTELLSLLLEAIEIKRLWPLYNRAMKRQEPKFALYCYEDQQGYRRLLIGKHKKGMDSVYLFNLEIDAVLRLRKLIHEFALSPELCGFKTKGQLALLSLEDEEAKAERLGPEEYNRRVEKALEHFTNSFSSFAILDKGRDEEEQSCIWIENGSFYGFGYISHYSDFKSASQVKELVTRYIGNEYMMQLINSHAEKYPHKVLRF